jgi:membrane protease YdiL (CAAX protease family)
MTSLSSQQPLLHACPSCGRATALTDYGPEPSLCVECQSAFGLLVRAPEAPSPDDPVWGIPESIALWIAAFCALLAAEAGAVLYLIYAGRSGLPIPAGEAIITDPPLLVARFLSLGVAHGVTFLLAYMIVTDAGRWKFLPSVGWGWRSWVWVVGVLVAFVGVFVVAGIVGQVFGQPEDTPFHKVLKSSFTARLAVGVFAVISAPLVEEVVYRGVMYPAFARRIGRVAAILVVSGLFLVVHADQYAGEPAILIPLGTLSLALTALRAYSGSLLPSFALHLLFNAVQVAFILIGGPDLQP